jgi:hypothetical protein
MTSAIKSGDGMVEAKGRVLITLQHRNYSVAQEIQGIAADRRTPIHHEQDPPTRRREYLAQHKDIRKPRPLQPENGNPLTMP